MRRTLSAVTAALAGVALTAGGLLAVGPAAGAVVTTKAAPAPIAGAVLEWTGSAEMQANQPAAPAAGAPKCSFFSAGISVPYAAGGQASYRASSGNVSIRKGTALASWATRCRGVTASGDVHQKVVVTGGTGTVDPTTGATTIQWSGSWAVNFYGGMIPFSITDPKLVVTPSGTGSITATLGGYAGELGSPDVEPIPPVPGVVVASLSGVASGNLTGFVSTPRYAGVRYPAPDDQAPQNRVNPGWGSWPQSFVDFHVGTGLHSYWYSSGGSADSKKAPAPVVVKYSNAKAASTATVTVAKKKLKVGKKLKVKIKVKAAGGVTPTGKVTLKDKKKTVASKKLKSGKAVLKLKNLKKGKHKLWASYAGSALVLPDASPKVKVKVTR